MSLFIVQICAAQTKSALFLGNSYTYFNNLPKLVADIASSNGDSLIYDSNTPGGYTLQGHTTNATSLSKLKSKQWDYVILQEQSQKPSFNPSYVQSNVYPYAKQLADSIEANDSCSKPLFYMTWGRKYGDQGNCASYPPVCTYAGMQKRLRESYVQMAIDNDASVAPVGQAWKWSIAKDSTINLYDSDNSHPNLRGSYLAACVFYSSMFHKSSFMSYIPPGIPIGEGLFLQSIADSTVFDSLTTWQIDTLNTVTAAFNFQLSFMTVSFNGSSNINGSKFHWDFGDGSTSNLQNPTHLYLAKGKYNACLTVQKDCKTNTICKLVDMDPIGIEDSRDLSKVEIYPNPCDEVIYLNNLHSIVELEVYDSFGRMILNEEIDPLDSKAIYLPEEKGLYLFKLQKGQEIRTIPVIRK